MGVVAVALALGGVGLVTILRANLERGVADAAALRAADVAALVATGSLPSSIVFPGEERSVIQVIDRDGVVVSSTSNIAGEAAVAVRPASGYVIVDLPVGDGQRFALTAKTVQGSSGPVTILSGESLERVDATRRAVVYALAGGLPALLGVVAVLAWVGAGRALR